MRTYLTGRSLAFLAGLLLFAASSIGCGGEKSAPPSTNGAAPAPPATAGSFDPCSLLTASEVEAAVGWKPDAVTPFLQPKETGYCKFTGPDKAALTPQQVSAGVGVCPTNMACSELPEFASSADLVAYRKKGYQESASGRDLNPRIVAIEGLGVPAIEHELLGLIAVEMAIGQKKLAYVEAFAPSATVRGLAEKLLARVRAR